MNLPKKFFPDAKKKDMIDRCDLVADANNDSSGDLDVITGDVTINLRRTMRKAIEELGFVSDKYKEMVKELEEAVD
nr:hypothetical protein [Tanacetum cinerariifolium]